MVAALLVYANIAVAATLITLLVSYTSSYYWWRSGAGRIVVSGLLLALVVVVGGLCERFGDLAAHDVLVLIGYVGGTAVLFLATRHVLGVALRSRRAHSTITPDSEEPR